MKSLFPDLELNHIFYLLQHFQPSKLEAEAVPSSVLQTLRRWGAKSANVDDLLLKWKGQKQKNDSVNESLDDRWCPEPASEDKEIKERWVQISKQ